MIIQLKFVSTMNSKTNHTHLIYVIADINTETVADKAISCWGIFLLLPLLL